MDHSKKKFWHGEGGVFGKKVLISFMDGAIFDLIFKANIFFFLIETFHMNKMPVFLFVCFVLGLQHTSVTIAWSPHMPRPPRLVMFRGACECVGLLKVWRGCLRPSQLQWRLLSEWSEVGVLGGKGEIFHGVFMLDFIIVVMVWVEVCLLCRKCIGMLDGAPLRVLGMSTGKC